MTISEKVAYIKGLAEGLGIGEDTKEDKILTAIIDVLGEMAEEINDLGDEQIDISDELDAVSEDLSDVEEYLFGDEEDDYEEFDDDEAEDEEPCCCEPETPDEDELEFEATCPECGADIALSEADLNKGSIKCPACGEVLEFEYDGEEDEE